MNATDNWLKDGLEILNPRNHPLSLDVMQNAQKLIKKVQEIQDVSGIKIVRSTEMGGYRTKAEQLKTNPKAPNSWHTKFAAIDCVDVSGQLWAWLTSSFSAPGLMGESIPVSCDAATWFGIWLEDRSATPTWVHFQLYPPKSGKRIFKP